MKKWICATAVALGMLAGCASKPQPAVPLTGSALAAGVGRIGVAMTELPKVELATPGADCLLCLAAASIANSSLSAHAKTLGHEDLPRMKEAFADMLRKRGAEPVVIADAIDPARLPASRKGEGYSPIDFTSLAKLHGIDRLLFVRVTQVGIERSYRAYIPTGDPRGVLRADAALIDLKTLAYEWYQPVAIARTSDGKWDEPPKFPGLTNAYFQAVEQGKDELLGPLKP